MKLDELYSYIRSLPHIEQNRLLGLLIRDIFESYAVSPVVGAPDNHDLDDGELDEYYGKLREEDGNVPYMSGYTAASHVL